MVDMYDDNGELLKVAAPHAKALGVDLKELQEKAIPVDKKNTVKFPDEEFALRVQNPQTGEKSRHLSMSDEANTLLSAIYFMAKGHQMPEDARKRTAGRLAERLGTLGHSKAAEVLSGYASGVAKKDTEDTATAKKKKDPKQPAAFYLKGKSVPVGSKEDIEAVASDIEADLHNLDPLDRRAAALQVVAFGVEPPGRLGAYAGMEKNAGMAELVDSRYRQVREADRGTALSELHAVLSEKDLEKQAVLLCRFDDKHGPFMGLPDAILSTTALAKEPEAAPAPVQYPESTLSKVASIMGEDVVQLLRGGKEAELSQDARGLVSRLHKEASAS